jgi:hypothetical protein
LALRAEPPAVFADFFACILLTYFLCKTPRD